MLSDLNPQLAMRTLSSALLLLLALSPSLAAQRSRFSITPVAGWSASSPLLRHTIRINDGTLDYTSDERLTLGSALNLGARLGVYLSPGWTLFLQGTSASSPLSYLLTGSERSDSGVVNADPFRRTDDATTTTATLALARSVALSRDGSELELSLGAGLQHLARTRRMLPCPDHGLCDMPEPFIDHFELPSAVAGVALRRPLSRALSAELRGSLLLGRMSTENVRITLAPQWEGYQAPDHQSVRTLQGSFGLSWRP